MSLLTPAKLKLIMPNIAEPGAWVAALDPAIAKYQITTKARLAAFIAQLAHESGEFNRLKENLNYSAARLRAVWPSRFPDLATANKYAHQPEKLANHVYANRLGNGNSASGDGWKYRGRGLIQTTGRSNYDDTGDAIGKDLLANPDLLATDKAVIALAAAYFWKSRGLNALADENAGDDHSADFKRITKLINGGTNGHVDRVKYWQRAKTHL